MGAADTSRLSSRSAQTSRKRSRTETLDTRLTGRQAKSTIIIPDEDEDEVQLVKVKKISKTKSIGNEEKRLKQFRKRAPGTWLTKLERAQTQRMFVLNRERSEIEGVPQEAVELAGSTGNVYSVIIKQIPTCTCPDSTKNGCCKHIIYVLRFVLKAPADLEYQAAFLISELKQIFEQSPLPQLTHNHESEDDSNRKPIDGDCPVCFMEFDPATEEIVWCKAACGNNIHKECFEKWAKSHSGKAVRCVYCRAEWAGNEQSLESIRAVKAGRTVNREGYVNLASELGISTYRDTSTYHGFWLNNQRRTGNTFDTV